MSNIVRQYTILFICLLSLRTGGHIKGLRHSLLKFHRLFLKHSIITLEQNSKLWAIEHPMKLLLWKHQAYFRVWWIHFIVLDVRLSIWGETKCFQTKHCIFNNIFRWRRFKLSAELNMSKLKYYEKYFQELLSNVSRSIYNNKKYFVSLMV